LRSAGINRGTFIHKTGCATEKRRKIDKKRESARKRAQQHSVYEGKSPSALKLAWFGSPSLDTTCQKRGREETPLPSANKYTVYTYTV
jgi:hypothetical protein